MSPPRSPHARIAAVARRAPRVTGRLLTTGLSVAAELNRIRMEQAWRREVELAGSGDGPLVVGPWLSEVGFEVLYWIPMLNHVAERHGLAPADVHVVTRGGAHSWYRGIADSGVELFDLLSPDELRERNENRIRTAGGQKHMAPTELDREILRLASDALPAGARLIHPSVMYNAFRYFWAGRTPQKAILQLLRFRPLPDPGRADIAAKLPDDYVAVKAYFSSSFPDTPANRAFVAGLVRRLAARTPVVLLSTGLRVDDHLEVDVEGDERLIDAQAWMTPRDNLEVQSQIIRGARCLFSSYGGFSYLGPLLGTPSVCFWSDANFNFAHLELMRRAVAELSAPRFVALDTADVELLDRVLAPDFAGVPA